MGQDSSGDVLNDVVDAVVNIGTVGVVGYENGKIKKGFALRNLDETIGEVTGRNSARKTAMEQKDAIEEEKKAKAKELQLEQETKRQQDIQSSSYAGLVRTLAKTKQENILGSGPTRDFLGL